MYYILICLYVLFFFSLPTVMFPCCSLPDKEDDPEDVLDAGKEDAHDGAQVGLPGGGGVLGRNYNRKCFRAHNLHHAIIVGLS
jgi:hypothetical protein